MTEAGRQRPKGSRAEALAYMPIPRINHVVQRFIPAIAGRKVKNSKSDNF